MTLVSLVYYYMQNLIMINDICSNINASPSFEFLHLSSSILWVCLVSSSFLLSRARDVDSVVWISEMYRSSDSRKLVLFYFLMVEIFVVLINSRMLLVSIFLLLYFCFHTNGVKIKPKVIKCNFKVKISKTKTQLYSAFKSLRALRC